MLQIKCRAWDEKSKTMSYGVENLFEPTNLGGDFLFENFGEVLEAQRKGDLIVELYTGRKGKHNKEICQGDIVGWVSVSCTILIGKVIWNDEEAEFYIEQLNYPKNRECSCSFYGYQGREFEWEDLEVIGNVHENPELLGG